MQTFYRHVDQRSSVPQPFSQFLCHDFLRSEVLTRLYYARYYLCFVLRVANANDMPRALSIGYFLASFSPGWREGKASFRPSRGEDRYWRSSPTASARNGSRTDFV